MVTDRMPPLRVGGPRRAPGRPALPLGHPRTQRPATRQRPVRARAGPERPHPGGEGGHLRRPPRPPAARPGAAGLRRRLPAARGIGRLTMTPDADGVTGGYGDEPRRASGFFTDTSICIGCKACEVACKEWNRVPDDGRGVHRRVVRQQRRLGANRWRHVAFIEQRRPVGVEDACPTRSCRRPPSRASRGGGPRAGRDGRHALADELRRLQALHRGRLPGRVPDRRVVPNRVRHGRRAARRLQRMRLLRRRLPLRGPGPAPRRRPRVEVHPLLRPPEGRHGARLRPGLPDQVDPVRGADDLRERAGERARDPAGGGACATRACTGRTRTTASAASAPSSCCSTSRRSTGSRPTPWSRPGDLRRDLGNAGLAAAALGAIVAASALGGR